MTGIRILDWRKPNSRHRDDRGGCAPVSKGPLLAFARARDGVVTIEMALIAIVLATLALGAFDFGRVGIAKSTMTSAARAGAQYGIQDLSTANDTSGMETAALEDTTGSNLTLTAAGSSYCSCPVDGPVACTASCSSDGGYAPMYVQVTVSGDVALLFSYPGVPDPISLSATSVMRVR